MTDSPRWERESQEDLRSSAPQLEETVELDMEAAGLVDPAHLSEPPEYGGWEPEESARADGEQEDEWPDREPRLAGARESLSATRDSIATTAGRVGRWFASLDRRPDYHDHLGDLGDLAAQLSPPVPSTTPETSGGDATPAETEPVDGGERFPIAALGYNRQAVDRQVAALEAELERLRAATEPAPASINEEIERLGEQTASILVVAHDKAHETARRAEEQAARAVREASAQAERITAEAERQLRELDDETDTVWRERERLLDDVRVVSQVLTTLADEASARFPAAEPRPEPVVAGVAPALVSAEPGDVEPDALAAEPGAAE
jgi:hypothetical protein